MKFLVGSAGSAASLLPELIVIAQRPPFVHFQGDIVHPSLLRYRHEVNYSIRIRRISNDHEKILSDTSHVICKGLGRVHSCLGRLSRFICVSLGNGPKGCLPYCLLIFALHKLSVGSSTLLLCPQAVVGTHKALGCPYHGIFHLPQRHGAGAAFGRPYLLINVLGCIFQDFCLGAVAFGALGVSVFLHIVRLFP